MPQKAILLSNINLDLATQFITGSLDVASPPGYGQWVQYTFSEGGLVKDGASLAFLLLDGGEVVAEANTLSEGYEAIDSTFDHIERFLLNNPGVPIYISNLDFGDARIQPGDSAPMNELFVRYSDELLERMVQNFVSAHRFDLRFLIQQIGRANFYSPKMWYLGSIPYSITGNRAIGAGVISAFEQAIMQRKKVLVLDLDNTLWGGVLGEDGITGIELGDSKTGRIFRDTQRRIRELASTGVLLAISSKNDIQDVEQVLASHPNMILRRDDFVAVQASWESKSQQIVEIANELNLGLDSFVFLDDNPVERASVQAELPDITVLDFPQKLEELPATVVSAFNDYFFTHSVTAEDMSKTEQYLVEAKRNELKSAASSIDDYLKSLDMEIRVGRATESSLERVAQLTQKTNQFNVLSNRFSLEGLDKYRNESGHLVLTASVKDSYGDSGLVCVLMAESTGNIAKIDNFLLSCRVMGRKIESAVMNQFVEMMQQQGVGIIEASVKFTDRNAPVHELFESLGYSLISSDSESKHYELNVSDVKVINSDIHRVIWDE